ncbi:MAG: BON domain-containing protein [bacterium]
MRTIRWLLLIGCTISLVVGCSTIKKKKTDVVDDKAICTDIEQQLLAETGPTGPFSIDIDSYRGTVTLDGTVGSEDQKAMVLDIVQAVPGVEKVHSFLEVSSSP